MPPNRPQVAGLPAAIESMHIGINCLDLAASVQFYTRVLGMRIVMTMPADNPDIAILEGYGLSLRLQRAGASELTVAVQLMLRYDVKRLPGLVDADRALIAPEGTQIRLIASAEPALVPTAQPEFVIARASGESAWIEGRAGMRYRDLIPGRWGGRYVASHIRIDQAGPVDDYVHYHDVRFQMIYCLSGWVRVVYQDQGPPFVLQAGDCVLQPPQIRHRVLECSAGLEVVELGCPAVHPTYGDPNLTLPNATLDQSRCYANQRFHRHIATDAQWTRVSGSMEVRDTQIAQASAGLAQAEVFQATADSRLDLTHTNEFQFIYALDGSGRMRQVDDALIELFTDDALSIPPNEEHLLDVAAGSQWLRIRM